MEQFQNRQNGRRKAIRTFKVTLRTRRAKTEPKPGENQVMQQPTPPRAHAPMEISIETRWIAHAPWEFQTQGIKAASDLALDSFPVKT